MGQAVSQFAEPYIVHDEAMETDDHVTCDLCSCCTTQPYGATLLVCEGCGCEACTTCLECDEPDANQDWFCIPCAYDKSPATLKCTLCRMPAGYSNLAFRQSHSGAFAHIACYNWLQEPDKNDSKVNAISQNSRCHICREETVAGEHRLIECNYRGCKNMWHVPCMILQPRPFRRAKYWLSCPDESGDGSGQDHWVKHFYCSEHATSVPRAELQQMQLAPDQDSVPPAFYYFPAAKESSEGLGWRAAGQHHAVVAAAVASGAPLCSVDAAIAQLLEALARLIDIAPTPGLRHARAVAALLDLASVAFASDTVTADDGTTAAAAAAAGAQSAAVDDAWCDWRTAVATQAGSTVHTVAALHRLDLCLCRRLLLYSLRTEVLENNTVLEEQQRVLVSKMHCLRVLLYRIIDPMTPLKAAEAAATAAAAQGSSSAAAAAPAAVPVPVHRATACVACLQTTGSNLHLYCAYCGVRFHSGLCEKKVASKERIVVAGSTGSSSSSSKRKPVVHLCHICKESDRLLRAVKERDIQAVFKALQESAHANPSWQVNRSRTALHWAAGTGWYDGLSCMLHYVRRGGGLPAVYMPVAAVRCSSGVSTAAAGGSAPSSSAAVTRKAAAVGSTARVIVDTVVEFLTPFDDSSGSMACRRLLQTTFSGLPAYMTLLRWPESTTAAVLTCGADISHGQERVPVPWINTTGDGDVFPSHTFGYITCPVEGPVRCCSIPAAAVATATTAIAITALDATAAGTGATIGAAMGATIGATAAAVSAEEAMGLAFDWKFVGTTKRQGCELGSRCSGGVSAASKVHNRTDAAVECHFECSCYRMVQDEDTGQKRVHNCGRRGSQAGLPFRLQVFKSHVAKLGWGVRTLEFIKKGSYVCSYAGEIITGYEYEVRSKEYLTDQRQGCCYVYQLDKASRAKWFIDATRYRNVAAFFNHKCGTGNLTAKKLLSNYGAGKSSTLYPATLAFYANWDIAAGTELVFNYGCQVIQSNCVGCGAECCPKQPACT